MRVRRRTIGTVRLRRETFWTCAFLPLRDKKGPREPRVNWVSCRVSHRAFPRGCNNNCTFLEKKKTKASYLSLPQVALISIVAERIKCNVQCAITLTIHGILHGPSTMPRAQFSILICILRNSRVIVRIESASIAARRACGVFRSAH